MTPTHLTAAQMRLWANLALAVIDIETTQHPKGGYRVVEVAVMTSRSRRVSTRWSQLVNPQIPIDAASQKVHGITDEAVATYPEFSEVAETFLDHLTQQSGETLVVVCHNAGFDLPILRAELQRAGHDLPTLPVLDTARRLPGVVGIHPPTKSLQSLCDELDVPYAPQHQASGDARSLSDAVSELFDLAVAHGLDNITEILNAAGNLSTDHYHRQPRHISPTGRKKIPQPHLDAHTLVLPPKPTKTRQKKWQRTLIDCAGYRCEEASDMVANAEAAPDIVAHLLDLALEQLAASGDAPGVATLLAPAIDHIPNTVESVATMTRRNRVIKRSRRWRTAFQQLRCCGEDDPCPDCLDYLPCPLDTWCDTLAAVAVGTDPKQVERFYDSVPNARGDETRSFYRWMNNGDSEMAWSGVAAVIDYWRSQGDLLRADKVARFTYEEEGCRHPTVVARVATLTAGPGQPDHLDRAISLCDAALADRHQSVSVPWKELERTRRRLDGLLRQITEPSPTGARARKPRHPKREHPKRFIHVPTVETGSPRSE